MSEMIEVWGCEFDKFKETYVKYDDPLPEYNISKSGVMVLCKTRDKYLKLLKDDNHHCQNGYDVVMMKVDVKEMKRIVMC